MNNQHEYQGSFIACLKCCKPKSDPIHCMATIIYEHPPIELFDPNGREIPSTCAGHPCPSCRITWHHNYDCGVDSHGLCERCAQQTAALINRPNAVEEIGLQTKHLTPREVKELEIIHEEFVFKNIFYDPITGEDRGQAGYEAGAIHVQQIEKIIEQCKVKLSGYSRAKATKQVQDLNKLTPEEREQFARDASRTKKEVDKRRAPKLPDITEDLAITKMAKLLMSIDKKLSLDQAIINATKAIGAAK